MNFSFSFKLELGKLIKTHLYHKLLFRINVFILRMNSTFYLVVLITGRFEIEIELVFRDKCSTMKTPAALMQVFITSRVVI